MGTNRFRRVGGLMRSSQFFNSHFVKLVDCQLYVLS